MAVVRGGIFNANIYPSSREISLGPIQNLTKMRSDPGAAILECRRSCLQLDVFRAENYEHVSKLLEIGMVGVLPHMLPNALEVLLGNVVEHVHIVPDQAGACLSPAAVRLALYVGE